MGQAAEEARAQKLTVRLCGPADAELVHALTQSAFEEYARTLDPPTGALRETVESVRADLVAHGGAIAWRGDDPLGCLRFEVEPGHLHVRRVAVRPDQRHAGVGTALMEWAHDHARRLDLPEVRLGVRRQLEGNRGFYGSLGYEVVGAHRHPGAEAVTWYEMRLKL